MGALVIVAAAVLGAMVGWILRDVRAESERRISYCKGRVDALTELSKKVKGREK